MREDLRRRAGVKICNWLNHRHVSVSLQRDLKYHTCTQDILSLTQTGRAYVLYLVDFTQGVLTLSWHSAIPRSIAHSVQKYYQVCDFWPPGMIDREVLKINYCWVMGDPWHNNKNKLFLPKTICRNLVKIKFPNFTQNQNCYTFKKCQVQLCLSFQPEKRCIFLVRNAENVINLT